MKYDVMSLNFSLQILLRLYAVELLLYNKCEVTIMYLAALGQLSYFLNKTLSIQLPLKRLIIIISLQKSTTFVSAEYRTANLAHLFL